MMKPVPARFEKGVDPLRRLVLMRWFAVAGQFVLIAAAGPLLDIALPLAPMLGIVALQAGFNLFTRRRLASGGGIADGELFAQLGVDITALTLLLFFSGGAANPLVSLYLLLDLPCEDYNKYLINFNIALSQKAIMIE